MTLDSREAATVSEKNREYWNAAAHTVFNEQWVRDLHRQITEHLQENVNWIGLCDGDDIGTADVTNTKASARKMLDYACGNGVLSRALSGYCHFSTCIGIDIAPAMVEQYNIFAREQGFSETQMYAVQGDLVEDRESLNGDEFFNFDLVVICLALHHLADPQDVLKHLAARLRVGGVLLIIDWAPDAEDGRKCIGGHVHDHVLTRSPAAHTITHLNFSKGEIESALGNAGCDEVDFVLHPESSVVPMAPDGKKQLFFARARKFRV